MKTSIKALFLLMSIVAGGASSHADIPPQRIVAAGGDITEIIYALGAIDRLVGVDSTSRYPGTVESIAQIGYVRRVSPEGVLSLKPDLVIGADDMGPPAAMDQLRATGVKVAVAPKGDSPDGVIGKIRFVGRQLGLDETAEKLAEKVRDALSSAISDAAAASKKRRVIFVLSVGDSGVLVGGAETAANEIITLAGGVNAASGFSGYKPMSREAILQAQPDAVLMMRTRESGHGSPDYVLARPEFKLTPAAQTKSLYTMDGLLLLGFGPRTPSAINELSALINR